MLLCADLVEEEDEALVVLVVADAGFEAASLHVGRLGDDALGEAG